MPDLEISKLPELSGPGLNGDDPLAIADMSASETKKITAKNLVQAGVLLIDDNSIPADKVLLPPIEIPDGSITTDMLQDGAVTDDKIDSVNGSKIVDYSITGNKLGPVTDRGLDQKTDKIGHANEIVAGGLAGIEFDEYGHAISIGDEIPAADLPVATETTIGAVSVPTDSGLTVDPAGALKHANNITGGLTANILYDEHGHILNVDEITADILPIATETELGIVKVPAAGGLIVGFDGSLSLSDSGVTPNTYTKVTVDRFGRVTQGSGLDAGDIPNLDASQIPTGQFGTAQIADDSITAAKLSDYSTCLMQEDHPGEGDFLGQFWYTPSTAQLRVYARGSGPENIWLPVGFGALQANNLRWGGTYNADTDTLGVLTSIAVSAGLTAGQPFPAPSDELSGMYFVCQADGNNMTQPNLSGIGHSQGDWALCVDAAQGWIHIDANQGGSGGGGSAQYLNDLLDVEIGGTASPFSTAPAVTLSADQLLRYDGGSGLWRNTDIIDGGSID